MLKTKREAFSLIELVFVISIVGVLAAIAIPKLAENRDNAAAKVCQSEASNFITEMSGYYTKNSGWDRLEEITNLQMNIVVNPGNGQHGLLNSGNTIPTENQSLSYICNGEVIMTVIPKTRLFVDLRAVEHDQYELVIEKPSSIQTQPAMIAANELALNNIYKSEPGYRIGGY